MSRPRSGAKYCSFDGCMMNKADRTVSFFALPANEERRKKWLEVMNRPDLLRPDLKPHSYVVCSKHFDQSSIMFTPKVKPDAIPTLFPQETKLCNQVTQTEDISSIINIKKENDCSEYTEQSFSWPCLDKPNKSNPVDKKGTLSKNTQTTMALLANMPAEKKLKKRLHEALLDKRKLQYELDRVRKRVQLKESEKSHRFTYEIEDEVTRRFCKLIDWQSKMNKHAKGNRFDREFKAFALNLHFSSPKTYRRLKKYLRLPSEATLNRFKRKNKNPAKATTEQPTNQKEKELEFVEISSVPIPTV